MADGQFTCPDCGKTFETPQGLGSHRARAHGYRNPRAAAKRQARAATTVSATTAAANGKKSTTKKSTAKKSTSARKLVTRRAPPLASAIAPAAGRKRKRKNTMAKRATRRTPALDKNLLLRTVFPKGLPNDADTIVRASAWLEEAKQLHQGDVTR